MFGDLVSRLLKPDIERLRAKWDVEGLVKALNHRDYKIRKKAAKALGEMRAREATDPLIRAIKDENVEVRKAVAYALGRMGDEKAIKPLIEALKDESLDVRTEAAKSLKEIGHRKVSELPKLISESLNVPLDEALRILGEIRAGRFGFFK